jgi:hypothetical protein
MSRRRKIEAVAAVTPVLPRNSKSGRGDWIRTRDPLRPRPRPAIIRNFLQRRTSKSLIHRWICCRDPLFGGVSDRMS